MQELRDFKHNKLKWMSKKLKRVTPSRLVRLPALRNRFEASLQPAKPP